MHMSSSFSSSAPWILFGYSFLTLQATADVFQLKLCNDFVTPITEIQKFSKITNGGEHDFSFNRYYMS
jgi:hypothetical protein